MPRGLHPLRFFALILPYGAAYGYAAVALQYVATQRAGISVQAFAAVLSSALAVHGVKFLWAPLVDTTLTKRAWYLIALALTVGGVLASSLLPIQPATLTALTLVVMAAQVGLTFMGMACETLLAALPRAEKPRASGFYQAGTFVGLGLGGGLALRLTTLLPARWMGASLLCACMVPCALALVGVPEPDRPPHGLLQAMRALGENLKAMIVRRVDGRTVVSVAGVTAVLVVLSPIGAGAAGNLWPSVAAEWSAGQGAVELVNGWLGGVVSAAGALCGGYVAARMERLRAYVLAGALTALAGLAMAAGPRAPWAFVAGALLYSAFNGMVYAALSALVLETISAGAAATEYNLFASLANLAISYMTSVDAWAFARHGSGGMLRVDALCTFAGIALILALVAALRRLAPAAAR